MIAREYEDGNIESIEISAAGDSGCAIVVLHISKEYGNSGSEFSINQVMTAREARILAGWLEKAADEAEQEQEDRIAEDAEFNRIKPLEE